MLSINILCPAPSQRSCKVYLSRAYFALLRANVAAFRQGFNWSIIGHLPIAKLPFPAGGRFARGLFAMEVSNNLAGEGYFDLLRMRSTGLYILLQASDFVSRSVG